MIAHTRINFYGEYTLYYEGVLYDNISNVTLDDCNIYDENKNKVPVNELSEGIRKEILKEFI